MSWIDGAISLAEQRELAAPVMRQRAAHDRLGEPLARRDPQAPVVEEGALAVLGGEELVVGRIVDQRRDDRALALQRDRDREVRDAVQEVGGAVERIDDPGVGLVGALVAAAFLAEEAVAGPRLEQLGAQDLLGAPVGGGDEIRRALQRHLQFSTSPKSRLRPRAGLAGGVGHDLQQGGLGGHEELRAPKRRERRSIEGLFAGLP